MQEVKIVMIYDVIYEVIYGAYMKTILIENVVSQIKSKMLKSRWS